MVFNLIQHNIISQSVILVNIIVNLAFGAAFIVVVFNLFLNSMTKGLVSL